MLTEDYISFETAKLLKEKGFDEFTFSNYDENGIVQFNEVETRIVKGYQRPTLQMTMKWLREVHNLFIEPRVGEINGKTWYDFDIIPINGRKINWDHYNNIPLVELNSYEEAVELAIKYCLENLI